MGYKAAAQILKQAEDLKVKVLRKSDLLNDSEAWTDQQKLQTIYQQTLILDLEYALDKKVEQDLWNVGFKNHISVLQELARDKKNPRRSECQALLTWCLEAASGFYLTLLHELCNSFDIDLPFRRQGNVYGQITPPSEVNLPQSSSCLYICQYCLVHLGDIARYRNQRKQAENFYKQAILVSPSSGHPYNQLALLEASRGDKLSTVFYYIRGIAVKNPFPASTTNLLSTLSSMVDKESPLERVQTKMTVNEFMQTFLMTHALLHTATDLNQAGICVKSLNTTMTALVATQSFTADKLIKITAINLYALKHVTSTSLTEELTEDEKVVRHYILELLAGSLSAFLVPVHTLKNDKSIVDYYALPAVRLLTYWIRNESDVLKESVFTNRLQIWPSLCKLLNNVQSYIKNFDFNNYKSTPLLEDRTLQGFRPILKNLKEFNFKQETESDKTESLIRVKRLIDFGLFVSQIDVNNTKLITKSDKGDKINFEPGCIQPDPTNELLEEMKSFNVSESFATIKGNEKRGGILKPQGSLEKAREERELLSSGETSQVSSDISNASSLSLSDNKKEGMKIKRSKQNVALQSIFKKMEESKQVKFNVEDMDRDKEKTVKFETTSVATPPQFNTSLRTQSFNQNHPAFPVQSGQQDYLNTLRNITKPPLNQPNNFAFPKPPDVSPSKMKTMPPPPMPYPNNLQTAQPGGFGPNLTNSSAFNAPIPSNSFQSRMVPPFQNMPFPQGNHPFKMDETVPPSTWWQNPTTQNYQRPEGVQMNYSFNNMMPFTQPDYNKPQNNQAGGDMFNSPWGNFGRSNFDDASMSRTMSTRQAMLKESGALPTAPGRPTNGQDGFMQTPGYSLFNTNSWSPNLVGQLRSTKPQEGMPHMPQHSLFNGQGPQSLAQLLEQQSQRQQQSQRKDV